MPFDGIPAKWEQVVDPDPVLQQLKRGRARIAAGWHRVPHGPKQRHAARRWWWQRSRRLYCVVTAVSVDASPLVAHAAVDLLCAAVGVKTRYELYAWNDAPGRVKADALLIYDRATPQESAS
jgi:hypothetical protein